MDRPLLEVRTWRAARKPLGSESEPAAARALTLVYRPSALGGRTLVRWSTVACGAGVITPKASLAVTRQHPVWFRFKFRVSRRASRVLPVEPSIAVRSSTAACNVGVKVHGVS